MRRSIKTLAVNGAAQLNSSAMGDGPDLCFPARRMQASNPGEIRGRSAPNVVGFYVSAYPPPW